MKARCPACCGKGCDDCDNGYIGVAFADGEWYARVCMDRQVCGFENGGCIRDEFPDEPPEDCIQCGGPTEWLPFSEVPDTEPGWVANRYQFACDSMERTIEALRQSLQKVQKFARLEAGGRQLTLDEAKLLFACRICGGKSSAPFVTAYGKEFAHKSCLEKADSSMEK